MSDAQRKTILVVEDEALVRMMTADLLDELGYAVIAVDDAKSAIATLQARDDVDLLLTDIGLPDIDGWTLAESARRLRPSLPVLFATGYGEDPKRQMAPGTAIIIKPFDTLSLTKALQELIETGERR